MAVLWQFFKNLTPFIYPPLIIIHLNVFFILDKWCLEPLQWSGTEFVDFLFSKTLLMFTFPKGAIR